MNILMLEMASTTGYDDDLNNLKTVLSSLKSLYRTDGLFGWDDDPNTILSDAEDVGIDMDLQDIV